MRDGVIVPYRWIANKKPNPRACLRCFIFPCAGAGVTYFRGWNKHVPENVDWLPVQLPGREMRFSESSFHSIDELLPALESGLSPFLDVPHIFFGHSLGALLAFCLARRLRTKNRNGLRHLYVAAFRSPRLPNEHSRLHLLPEKEFLERLLQYEGIPRELTTEPEILSLITAIARSDFQLHETYVYRREPQLPQPITVFGGEEDPFVRPEMLTDWQFETSGAFNLCLLPGGHHFLREHTAFLVSKILQG